jgi:hypothetical protein
MVAIWCDEYVRKNKNTIFPLKTMPVYKHIYMKKYNNKFDEKV